MLLRIHWTSVGRPTLDAAAAPPVVAPDLDALYADWQAAPNKGDFMSRLDAQSAAALCDHIFVREPRTGGCGRGSTRYAKGRD